MVIYEVDMFVPHLGWGLPHCLLNRPGLESVRYVPGLNATRSSFFHGSRATDHRSGSLLLFPFNFQPSIEDPDSVGIVDLSRSDRKH